MLTVLGSTCFYEFEYIVTKQNMTVTVNCSLIWEQSALKYPNSSWEMLFRYHYFCWNINILTALIEDEYDQAFKNLSQVTEET